MKDNIFSSIQNDNTAYWIGFLAADGALSKSRFQLQIGLARRDREHLEKFLNFIEATNTSINDREVLCTNNQKTYPSSFITIHNTQICKDLEEKWHLIPDKSHSDIDFLQYIPEEYKIPFILGLFDGDGFFTFTEKSQSFGFCGNQAVMNSIHDYLNNYFNWPNTVMVLNYNKSLITYYFTHSTKSRIVEFCNLYLSYSDKCDLLERKKEIAIELKEYAQTIAERVQAQKENSIARAKIYSDKYTEIPHFLSKICPSCGKEFWFPRYEDPHYCSQECAHKAQYRCEHPDKETLFNQLTEYKGNFTAVANLYGITDNTVRKWCKKYEIPFHSSDYNGKPAVVRTIRPVYKLDKNTNEILETFSSLGEAAKSLSKKTTHIKDACDGKALTAYGYKWRWADE